MDELHQNNEPPNLEARADRRYTITTENQSDEQEKNPAAVALGKLGGAKGGRARAAKMTPEERKESARKAAKSRWQSQKPEKESIPLVNQEIFYIAVRVASKDLVLKSGLLKKGAELFSAKTFSNTKEAAIKKGCTG